MSATIGLLFGNKYEKSSVAGIFLDATISEDHSYTCKATQFPLENGSSITDHVINDPVKLSLSGIVSDSPISFLSAFNRSSDAFNRLVRIHELKEKITIVTGIKAYRNMIMTSFTVPRDTETGQALSFVFEFQQITIDTGTQLILNNNPFGYDTKPITREQVADSEKYEHIQNDPPLSLKDQASSGINIGIQNLKEIASPLIESLKSSLKSYKDAYNVNNTFY